MKLKTLLLSLFVSLLHTLGSANETAQPPPPPEPEPQPKIEDDIDYFKAMLEVEKEQKKLDESK